jgi:hypothetical protein
MLIVLVHVSMLVRASVVRDHEPPQATVESPPQARPQASSPSSLRGSDGFLAHMQSPEF